MKIIKRAWINLVRMPVRNALYLTAVFVMLFVSVVCAILWRTGLEAKAALDTEYPIIATVIPRSDLTLNGDKQGYLAPLTLDVLATLRQSPTVRAYNYRLSAGSLAEQELITRLPDEELLTAEPAPEINGRENAVVAVHNLLMEREFLDGSFVMVAGEPFDEDDIRCGGGMIIISRTIAETYGLSVGDRIVCRATSGNRYRARVIKGIYAAVSGEPVRMSYIHLEDHFAEMADQGDGWLEQSLPDGTPHRPDAVTRIDFALGSAADAEQFILDARDLGLDFDSFEIIVNDRAYKTADAGLSQIIRITLLLAILSLIAGLVIILSITAYCRSTRTREAMILHCLGMKRRQITAMFAVELATVLLIGGVLGAACGRIAAKTAIEWLNDDYIATMQADANTRESVATSVMSQRTTALHYPLTIRFGERAMLCPTADRFIPCRVTPPADRIATRRACFYLDRTGEIVTLIGCGNMLSEGLMTEEILPELHRLAGFIFPCRAGADSGYSVGDFLRIRRSAPDTQVMVTIHGPGEVSYLSPQSGYVLLEVTELGEGSDLTLAMDDLELICSYLGVSSSVYRSVHYEAAESTEENRLNDSPVQATICG